MSQLPPIVIDPDTFLKSHCTLPALPEAVTRIQDIILSDDISISEVGDIISTDPGLVAQVLKIVNSAYYSFPKEIVDVHLAVAYLGINEIYRMVLSLAVFRSLDIQDMNEFSRIWHHSVYTALCSKYLAQKYERLMSLGELWAAAILHDVGKLIYLKFFPDHYKVMVQYSLEEKCLFEEAEKQFDFPSSGYFGSILCEHWRLPSIIKEVCLTDCMKDMPGLKGEGMTLAFKRLVCMGNFLAMLAKEDFNEELKKNMADMVCQILECSEEEFLVIMGDVYELEMSVDSIF